MIAIRSHFAPDNLEGVQMGDTVYFHVTNIEQDWDILHGFAVMGNKNSELILNAGRDAHAAVGAAGPGHLSLLLHGLLLGAASGDAGVRARVAGGSNVPLMANVSRKAAAQPGASAQTGGTR